MLQKQNFNSVIISRFTPATNLKIGTYIVIPNFTLKKELLKNYNHSGKDLYQINDKPTDVTYKLIDLNKKEIVQHRNNLLPYYSKEYALRENVDNKKIPRTERKNQKLEEKILPRDQKKKNLHIDNHREKSPHR